MNPAPSPIQSITRQSLVARFAVAVRLEIIGDSMMCSFRRGGAKREKAALREKTRGAGDYATVTAATLNLHEGE